MTPDLFDASVVNAESGGDIILIELLRGLAENGMLANLHKDRWLRHVEESRLTTLSPSLKDKVRTCLSVLHDRHRLVRHPKCKSGVPQNDSEWLNAALDSNDKIPFHAIFLSRQKQAECSRLCACLVNFEELLDSVQWDERRRRTCSLTKSQDEYRMVLSPVLRHAKSLMLIDPWLNCKEMRYLDTVKLCSRLAGRRIQKRRLVRIDIHTKASSQQPDGRSVKEHLDRWEKKLQPLINEDGHRFRVYLWEPFSGSESMHDRFILTDQCGISVPAGLDCRSDSHANTTDWSLLDERARQRTWNTYQPGSSPFNLLAFRELFP
jgi:hypothetical protein